MQQPKNPLRLQASEPADDLAKQIIRRQMKQAGNVLLCALEPLSDEEFFAGGDNGVSPAWTLGHLACVIDLFSSWVAGHPPLLSTRAHIVFNEHGLGKAEKTKAELVDPAEFAKIDIMLLFRQAQVHALEVLDQFETRLWDTPTVKPVPEALPTYGAIWQALGVHTFWHLGELCGCVSRFYGTYTLNTVVDYFYVSTQDDSATRLQAARVMP
jgi:hypothetical protein